MGPRRTCSPFETALGLFVTQLFWVCVAYSQRPPVSFGPYLEFSTPYPPSAVAVFTPRGASQPVIVAALAERQGLNRLQLSPAGRIAFEGTISTSVVPGTLVPMDVDGDGREDLAVLSADGSAVEIIRPGFPARAGQVIRLDHRALRLVAADINNDARKDLLLFGRTMSGVASLLAKPNGRFSPGPLYFPENSASDLVTADLNGDRIVDIVLLHWLANKFIVHFGIGRGMFSEQVSLTLPDEPRRIAFMSVQGRRTLRFLVTLPDEDAVAHIIGTPAGEFSLRETIPLQGRPLAVGFSLVNDDQLPDLVASTTAGIAVALGATATTFFPVDMFGAGAGSVSWDLDDIDGDRRTDLVIADRKQNRIVALGNALHAGPVAWPQEYAAGIHPGAVTTGDCTDDRLPDLVVANAGSSSVSIFQTTTEGRVLGHRTIGVPEKPQALSIVRGDESLPATLVTVHQSLEQLGISRLTGGTERSRLTTIPTEPRGSLLHAEVEKSSQHLRILMRHLQNGGSRAPLASYEEISRQRFLERSYRFTLPTAIAGMAVGDFTGGRERDLVIALRDRTTGVTTVSLATALAGYDFQRIQLLFALPDSTASVRFMVAGNLNADSTADLLLIFSQPRPALGYAFSTPDRRLVLDSLRTYGVNPGHELAIVLEDCDDDGDTDIVYLDEERDGVYYMTGSREGRFSGPRLLMEARGARHFAIGRYGPAGHPVIVLTHTDRHTVSIHQGIFAP